MDVHGHVQAHRQDKCAKSSTSIIYGDAANVCAYRSDDTFASLCACVLYVWSVSYTDTQAMRIRKDLMILLLDFGRLSCMYGPCRIRRYSEFAFLQSLLDKVRFYALFCGRRRSQMHIQIAKHSYHIHTDEEAAYSHAFVGGGNCSRHHC